MELSSLTAVSVDGRYGDKVSAARFSANMVC